MKIVLVSGIAWLIAQLLKLLLTWIHTKKINLYAMFASGGMPSSHTSFVIAMTTKMGLQEGFSSPFFALALCFSLIVMYDAAGVRHAVGLQAQMLNVLIDEYNDENKVDIERVKEILGHTPTQVLAGIFLGILVGVVGHQII